MKRKSLVAHMPRSTTLLRQRRRSTRWCVVTEYQRQQRSICEEVDAVLKKNENENEKEKEKEADELQHFGRIIRMPLMLDSQMRRVREYYAEIRQVVVDYSLEPLLPGSRFEISNLIKSCNKIPFYPSDSHQRTGDSSKLNLKVRCEEFCLSPSTVSILRTGHVIHSANKTELHGLLAAWMAAFTITKYVGVPVRVRGFAVVNIVTRCRAGHLINLNKLSEQIGPRAVYCPVNLDDPQDRRTSFPMMRSANRCGTSSNVSHSGAIVTVNSKSRAHVLATHQELIPRVVRCETTLSSSDIVDQFVSHTAADRSLKLLEPSLPPSTISQRIDTCIAARNSTLAIDTNSLFKEETKGRLARVVQKGKEILR